MNKYIGVRLVEATPITRGLYNTYRGWNIPADENPEDFGYMVTNESGQTNWFPRAEFEKENLPFLGSNNKVSQKDVDAMIDQIHMETIEPNDCGGKVTVLTATLQNGFTITESSSCVDPANYDAEVGIMCCMDKIESKIWYLLGFLLASGVYGFEGGK